MDLIFEIFFVCFLCFSFSTLSSINIYKPDDLYSNVYWEIMMYSCLCIIQFVNKLGFTVVQTIKWHEAWGIQNIFTQQMSGLINDLFQILVLLKCQDMPSDSCRLYQCSFHMLHFLLHLQKRNHVLNMEDKFQKNFKDLPLTLVSLIDQWL